MAFRSAEIGASSAHAASTHSCDAQFNGRSATTLSDAELDHHAHAIATVINASTKLQQLRNRMAALENALARFKEPRSGNPA